MSQKFTFLDKSRLDRLVDVFHRLFRTPYQTELVGGSEEPLYRPAVDMNGLNTIEFSYDYFSSALHECAHWCIAGASRREQLDYGYWYAPDGRSAQQQQHFESVEVRPQALERIFSFASGQPFRISVDNLDGDACASQSFIEAVHEQTITYCREGLPARASMLAESLAKEFNVSTPLSATNYLLKDLH
ncbi:MAG: elongation factor P hydroxylase [Agarilytica sp.]